MLKKILLIFFIFLFPALILSRDKSEPLNLEKIADDMKFKNGVQFLKLNREGKAIKEFYEYLEIYYNGTHRNEAYKYIAEIYFNQFDYLKAIKIYRELYEEFNNSENGIEAFYKIGICYKKMGYYLNAVKIFKEIINEHPDSTYSYQSRLQLDLLKIINEG